MLNNRKILLASSLAVIAIASALTLMGSPASSQQIPTRSPMEKAQIAVTDVQLTGTGKLSQWVALISRVDKSPAVICNDVSISLSGSVNSHAELSAILRAAGVDAVGPGPWRYNCASGPVASSVPPPAVQGVSYAMPGQVSSPEPAQTVQAPPQTIFSTFAEGGETVVDRLASNGFVPAGCIDAGNGVVKVAMRSRFRTHFVTLAEVKRSKIAPVVICRL